MVRPLSRRVSFWAALGVGASVRTIGLFHQVLVGDEVHAFRSSLDLPLPQVLVANLHRPANSPPFNAWLRLLVDLGWPPSELALRLPLLACGIGLLFIVPRWIERRLGTPTAVLAAWLLAISPHLVYYSRFMRPYGPVVLSSAVALGAFFDWWRTGRRSSGVTYALCAPLAVYFNLLAAPCVAAPFLFLLLEGIVAGRRALPPLRQLLPVAGLAAGLVGIYVLAAWPSLTRLLVIRRAPASLGLHDLWLQATLFGGTGAAALTVAFWVAVAIGALWIGRRDPALLRYGGCAVATQLVAVPLLSPAFLVSDLVLARYLLVILVPLLTLAAAGLAAPPGRLRWIGPVLIAGLAGTGPLVQRDLYLNPFGLRPDLLAYHIEATPPPKPGIPAPYAKLADGPPGAVIEFPVRPMPRYAARLARYQRLHRRSARISPGDERLADPRLGLRSVVAAEPETFLASSAAYLVVHRDWRQELGPWMGSRVPLSPPELQRLDDQTSRLARQARVMARRLRQAWGPPAHRSDELLVWDLDRARRSTAPTTRRPAP